MDYYSEEALIKPPYNIGAEAGVLSCLLLHGQEAAVVLNKLKPEHFYMPSHREVFEIISKQAADGRAFDLISVSRASNGNIDAGYLAELIESATDIRLALTYVDMLIEDHQHRHLIATCQDGLNRAYKREPAEEISASVVDSISALTLDDDQDETMKESMLKLKDDVKERLETGKKRGIDVGIPEIDECGGLKPKQQTLLTGVTGTGKTTLAMQMAKHAAKNGHHVAVFSMEMDSIENAERTVSSEGSLRMGKLDDPKSMDAMDWDRFANGITAGVNLSDNLHIFYRPAITPAYIRMKVQELILKYGSCPLVIVDHFFLMHQILPDNETLSCNHNARAFQKMKKELNTHFLILVQLTKDAIARGVRPNMGHIKFGGALIEDTHNALFLFRDEVLDNQNLIECYSGKARGMKTFNRWFGNQLQFNRMVVGEGLKPEEVPNSNGFTA
jgi:replicative DNA helicase